MTSATVNCLTSPSDKAVDGRADPIATIVISTRNRKDELRRTLASCLTLNAGDGWIEILVIDDASTDGTGELVRREFPSCRVVRQEEALGLIAARNLGAREARAQIIFSIDDDAVFTSADTVLRTLREFDEPLVGAVAMPHIHVTDSDREYDRAPDDGRLYVTATFTGTAHAVRRNLFVELGSYHAQLVRQGEETDICLRIYDSGHVVAVGRTAPIHHFPSTKRNYPLQLHYGARNGVLLTWFHAPAIMLIPRLLSNLASGCVNAVRLGYPRSFLGGVLAGFAGTFKYWSLRRPVSPKAYRLFRRLIAAPCQPFDRVSAELPAGGQAAAPSHPREAAARS